MTIVYFLCKILFLVSAVLMLLAVLMQEGRGGGVGGLFGGGATDIFGVKAKSVIKQFTIWLAIIMMGTCLVLNYNHEKTTLDDSAPTSAQK